MHKKILRISHKYVTNKSEFHDSKNLNCEVSEKLNLEENSSIHDSRNVNRGVSEKLNQERNACNVLQGKDVLETCQRMVMMSGDPILIDPQATLYLKV